MATQPQHPPEVELIRADAPDRVESARTLFREYAAGLGFDLAFQGFDTELAQLPGDYVEPGGQLLLALVDGELAGCGAFRPIPEVDFANACEMKRVFVRPAFRRFGLGRRLAAALMDDARRAGYSVMLLDTMNDMEAARQLYASLGFVETEPYYFNPIPGAHYLKADLDEVPPGY